MTSRQKVLTMLAILAALTGCMGPIGPPLGLGPAGDSAIGLLFIAALVAGVFYVVPKVRGNTGKTQTESTAHRSRPPASSAWRNQA